MTHPTSTSPLATGATFPKSWAGRVAGALLTVLVAMVWIASPSSAQSQTSAAELVIVRAPEGTSIELARFDVDPGLRGRTCELTASVDNQKSVNPGNDVVVRTGDAAMTLVDVEREAGIVTSATAPVVPAEYVVFTLAMGPREVFSGYLMIHLECSDSPAVGSTTSTTTTTTTTEKPAVQVSTTTASTTTVTVPRGEVEGSPPAVPVPGQPTFTG